MKYRGYRIVNRGNWVEVRKLKKNPTNRNIWEKYFMATDVELAKKIIDKKLDDNYIIED